MMVPVAVIGMILLSAWAIAKGQEFKAQDLGIGIGAILTGLGALKWGQSTEKRPTDSTEVTVVSTKTTPTEVPHGNG